MVVALGTRKASLAPSGATSTSISSPFENSPSRIFSDSGSSMKRWIARFSGRAPNFSSNPWRARKSDAASVSLSVSSSSPSRFCTSLSMTATIWAMCSFDSGWKTMTSSRRFRNSGLKTWLSSSFTFSWMRSKFAAASPPPDVKPSPLPLVMSLAPTFDVMITTVFLKSITRP